jgi:hypothetical protein
MVSAYAQNCEKFVSELGFTPSFGKNGRKIWEDVDGELPQVEARTASEVVRKIGMQSEVRQFGIDQILPWGTP